MGWYMIAAPGTEAGPCPGPCDHDFCREVRADADAVCMTCGKPIGFETKAYNIHQPDAEHAVCLWTRMAKERKRPIQQS